MFMKKLFTTVLLTGVALVSWGQSLTGSLSADGKTLTITYVADASAPNYLTSLENPVIDHLAGEPKDWESVETLTLIGDFANGDLGFISDKFVANCLKGPGNENKKIFLDLSGCARMKSTVVPADGSTFSTNWDWATKSPKFLPDGATTTYTADVTVQDVYNPVEYINNTVTITVEGPEVTYVHNWVTVNDPVTVFKNGSQYGAIITDLPDEFLNNRVVGQQYPYPNIYSDPNSYIAYNESEGAWCVYAWNSKAYTLYEDSQYTYTYVDENGDTQTVDNTNGFTQESDGYYYIRYIWTDDQGDHNQANAPENLTKVGEKWYKATSTTYAFKDENNVDCTQDNPNNPKQLTNNGDGTYSYIRYKYTDNNNQVQVQSDTQGLTDNGDGTYSYYAGKKYTYVNNEGGTVEVSQYDPQLTDNGDGTYSYTYTVTDAPFGLLGDTFKNRAGKLNGIAFPNNANFTAISNGLCNELIGLQNVVFPDNLVWIGNNAFNSCTGLNNVAFPQTLRVIGVDAFYKCTNFTEVDLRIRDLVKVDAAAFNMENDYDGELSEETTMLNKLATVYLPEEDNETLIFFANQVFSSSLITELDFTHCLGIKHFAYDGEEYFGETVPGNVSNTTRTFTWHRFLTKVTLPPNLLHVGDECFYKCTSLNELYFIGQADYNKATCPTTNVLKNALTIGDNACYTLPLTTLELSNNVTVIGERAFAKTALSEVRIPASVELIKTKAFEDCIDAQGNMTLKTIVFEEIDADCAPCQHAQTLITTEAFLENTAISDVYVNTVVDINCENHAFPFEVTFAQGDAGAASTGQAATLHFPAGHEAHYVNLSHGLDNETASDPGKFQKWLVDHLNAAQDQSTGYGWYEFINTGSRSIDPENPDPEYVPDPENPEELPLILRTFSDPNYARIVPDGMRAYIVNSVQKDETNNNFVLTLQRLSVIPKETGVVLFGQPNSTAEDGNYILTMSVVQFEEGNGQPLRRDYWDLLTPQDVKFKNYLMPIIGTAHWRTPAVKGVYDEAKDVFEETNLLTVNPYEPYTKGATVEWRNFALNRMSETEHLKLDEDFEFNESLDNFAGFFRILPGTYNSGYAYLHLSVDEYDDPAGAECVVTEDPDYFKEYNTSGNPYDPREKPGFNWWTGTNTWNNMFEGWGTRKPKFNKPHAVQYLGELDDTDGMVKLVIPENKMGEVFSISGMKVTNPSKGIYIQDGKKIIVK